MKVLFVHHIGIMGGSSRSLFENLRSAKENTQNHHNQQGSQPNQTAHEFVLMAPSGVMSQRALELGLVQFFSCRYVPRFDQTFYSHYRGWRWLILLLRETPFTFYFAIKALLLKRKYASFDVIHLNDSLLLQPAYLLKLFYPKAKFVFHARAVLIPRKTLFSKIFYTALDNIADHVLPIDETVKRSLDSKLPMTIIHDGLNPKDKKFQRQLTPNAPVVAAMVGTITKSKGSEDFVRAAIQCKGLKVPIKFVIYGAGNEPGLVRRILNLIGFGEFAEKKVREIIAEHHLSDVVEIKPFEMDLDRLYKGVDIICFPGRLDAPGRPIFEAAFFQIPSVVCISKPTSDTFQEGVTGFSIPSDDAMALADRIKCLALDPDLRLRMGRSAQQLAQKNFDNDLNTQDMIQVFRSLASSGHK